MTFSGDFSALLATTARISDQRIRASGRSAASVRLVEWRDQVFDQFEHGRAADELGRAYDDLATSDEGARLAGLLAGEVAAVRAFHDEVLRRTPEREDPQDEADPGERAGRRPRRPLRKALEMTSTVIGSLIDLLGDLFPWLTSILTIAKEAVDLLV